MPRDTRSAGAVIGAGLLHDPDAQVRLAALLSLADQPPSDEAGVAVAQALRGGLAANDPWLADAAMAAGAKNAGSFLKALVARGNAPPGAPVLLIAERVAEHWARGAPTGTAGDLLAALSGGEPAANEAILRGMARGWPKDRPARVDAATAQMLKKLTIELTPSARRNWSVWSAPGATRPWTAWVPRSPRRYSLRQKMGNYQYQAHRCGAAVDRTASHRSGGANGLLELITPTVAPELAVGLVEAVATSKAAPVGQSFVAILPKLSPGVRSRVLRILLGRSDWVPALVGWLEQDPARLSELALDQKQALAAHPNRDIAARAKKLLASGGGLPDRDRQLVIDRLAPSSSKGETPGGASWCSSSNVRSATATMAKGARSDLT